MATTREIPIPNIAAIKHQSDFFRDGLIAMTVIGKTSCGKTVMLSKILDGVSKSFETVIIATVTHTAFHQGIIEWFKKRGCASGKICEPEILSQYCEMARECGEVSNTKPGLIIFDDFNRGSQSIHCPYWKAVVNCFTKLRNEGWHFIIVAQQPSFIPTVVRNCTNARILFDCATNSAISNFMIDVKDRVHDMKLIALLVRYIREIPYSYIMVQEHPFTVKIGSGGSAKTIISFDSVRVPVMNEIMSQLGAGNRQELSEKAAIAQKSAGNTAEELQKDE